MDLAIQGKSRSAETGHRSVPVLERKIETPFANGSVFDCLILMANLETVWVDRENETSESERCRALS